MPDNENLVSNFYNAKKFMRPLGLGYDKYDMCSNCCMLWALQIELNVIMGIMWMVSIFTLKVMVDLKKRWIMGFVWKEVAKMPMNMTIMECLMKLFG